MGHVAIVENIKADLDRVDAESLLSIREIIDRSLQKVAALAAQRNEPHQFVGKNLLPEEYERLSLDDRGKLQWRLREQNHEWLKEHFSQLGAAWIVVVEGKVIASDKTLETKPLSPEILKICRATGKFPFIFANEKFITIEENASAWQPTIRSGDFYPTLAVKLGSDSGTAEVIGDFDTGSSHTFVDYDFFEAKGVLHPELRDYPEVHVHLNQSFVYIDKLLRVELPNDSGSARAVDARISCVQRWRSSPFTEINPNRVALIGRDVLFKLKPKVFLDFDQLQTEIMASGKTRQPRKSIQKKRTPRRRQ